MHKRQKRLVEVQIAHIAQRLGEESRVKQMHTGVLRAADILIYRQHFVYPFGIEGLFVVAVVGIAQEIPA